MLEKIRSFFIREKPPSQAEGFTIKDQMVLSTLNLEGESKESWLWAATTKWNVQKKGQMILLTPTDVMEIVRLSIQRGLVKEAESADSSPVLTVDLTKRGRACANKMVKHPLFLRQDLTIEFPA
ncbi:MAG: hypothetical protein A2958_02555 [Candidatus Levybacteria bacterium RIFCSPLOWO2_01_FULL_38_13]|nr:MAG: hypothetical protein A2629_02975 [Candidatus Levybacteria bacterium RIFCSPHIGHO2_01_FULL_41_15]OGH35219.1 MAG: hypothetical protein A2958_02555 [Candidatus Levybacteria bacterium RIFCSPLOWO2_01_FULL_38_13]